MGNIDYSNMMTKGVASSLESIPVENGKVRFTTDTNQLFIDMDGERHELSDIIRGYNESEIKSLLAPLPKLYLSSDTHKFFVYASGEWIVVGKNEWIGTKAEFEAAVSNGEIAEGMTVYITDDYTGDGADLSLYATTEYTNSTFIPKTDVVDNVTSTDTDKPLSAKQGKELNDKIATTDTRIDQQIGTNFIKEYDFQSDNFDITTVVEQNNYGLHMIRTAPTAKPNIGLPNSITQWGTLIIFNCLYKQILYISQDGELAVYGANTKKWNIVTMADDTDQLDAEI